MVIEFEELAGADLGVDVVYRGGTRGNAGDDPIQRLLPVGNRGGFRFRGSADRLELVDLVVLYSDLGEPAWPDEFDVELGRFVYFGDNRHPGHDLHDTHRKGNRILRDSFAALHAAEGRTSIPPFFVFTKAAGGRDVVFRGLAVPGADGLSSSEDLVAIWRSREGKRFQNYRARFTILDAAAVGRPWITSLVAGHRDEGLAPAAWLEWRLTGRYQPLRSPSAWAFRTPAEQLPVSDPDRKLLGVLYEYFTDGYAFEPCAAALWRMSAGRVDYTMTRPVRDGGRDAIGVLRLGPDSDSIELDFALEAKRYGPRTGVGVRDLARLVSRIRHRMFGVLVTTSFLDRQAYEELRVDGHPIVVVSGRDIIEILRSNGLGTADLVEGWLKANFSPSSPDRRPTPVADG